MEENSVSKEDLLTAYRVMDAIEKVLRPSCRNSTTVIKNAIAQIIVEQELEQKKKTEIIFG